MNFTTFKAKYSVLNECFLKRELFVLLTKIHKLETFCKRYNLIQTNLKQIKYNLQLFLLHFDPVFKRKSLKYTLSPDSVMLRA